MPPAPARERVPALAALLTALVGAINVASTMTVDLPERARDLLALTPATDVRVAHALALPVGVALIGAAWPLGRRHRRALHAAVALLAGAGVLNLLKGLDVEEATVGWVLAAVLWRSRAAFCVLHEPQRLGHTVRRAAWILSGAMLAAVGAVAVAASHAVAPLAPHDIPDAAVAGLTLTGAPPFRDPFAWLPLALGVLGAGSVAAIAAMALEPLRPRNVANALERRRAGALVRRHGTDTLSAFKLRADLQRRWSADGRALAAFRVEAGALLLAGDPVGPPEAVPGLLADLRGYAREHGLAFGAVGASEAFAEIAAAAGLRSMYLGDEAIIAAGEMDLEGRPNKNLRNAIRRVTRNGLRAELREVGTLDAASLGDMHAVSDRWRDGDHEKGFSMAHHVLVDELLPDALVVLARDGEDRVRAFLHFVPVFARDAVSLGFMRRDPDTPNGVTEFLVVEAARLLGERGVAEFSLNFAAYGRWLREPATLAERVLAKVLRVADRWFQVERLLRFNQKFSPRWQPRYLLYERRTDLPRVALAALWAEGQLPRPRMPGSGDAAPAAADALTA